MKTFTMSKYISKEELYKAKAEYFEEKYISYKKLSEKLQKQLDKHIDEFHVVYE